MAVLGTRLTPPVPRRPLVPRPRLADRLVGGPGLSPRLVLVAAPAGFGKTTLLVQTLTQADADHGRHVAWLSLDRPETEIAQVLADICEALDRAVPGVAGGALALLRSDREARLDEVLAALIDGLAETGPMVIVLDDYHLVESHPVHDAVTSLIDALPAHVTVAVTTRVDPPFPLARWRARGELLEIRAADLQFTLAEARAFLNEVMGLELDGPMVEALEERTEGWAAGLQLAALTARGKRHDELAGFVDAFAGSSRFVIDYLVGEVLRELDEETRGFLLRTSILTELSASLCDAVTVRQDGQETLARLERENLFLTGMDDERRWFRYHPLFADALRAQLGAAHAEEIPALHEAAARWYAAEGLPTEAIPHALAAGAHAYAAGLLQLALPQLKLTRQDLRVREWLRALPDDVVREHALLSAFMGWARMSEGDISGVARWLDSAESALARTDLDVGDAALEAELRELPATLESYRAVVSQATGDIEGTASHARRALALTPPDDHYARGASGGMLAAAEWATGDIDAAIRDFAAAIADLRAGGSLTNALGATTVLATMQLARGRADLARWLYEEALAEAERTPAGAPILGDLHVGLAQVLLEQGEVTDAEAHLAVAEHLGASASLPENRYRALVVHAGIARTKGRIGEAVQVLARAGEAYLPGYLPDVEPVGSVRARMLVEAERLGEAEAWADSSGARDLLARHMGEGTAPAYLEEHAVVTAAWILIAKEGPSEALADWLRLTASALAETPRRRGLAGIESLLGEPAPVITGPLVDPLSDREQEVLRLLASDLSGPDIARELYVSINTFRTHTKAIFAKLGVTSRREAVTRARELGLL